jgi:hypothetical protein
LSLDAHPHLFTFIASRGFLLTPFSLRGGFSIVVSLLLI